MNQEIENIIKKNLPEKKEHDWSKDEHTKTCKDGCTYCCNADGMITGFNQAISKINPSIIADEVLKVVVEKIKEKRDYWKNKPWNPEWNLEIKDKVEVLEDLLSNLSPNKENEIIHKNCGTKSCKGEYEDGVVDYLCPQCDCTFLDNDEQTIIS